MTAETADRNAQAAANQATNQTICYLSSPARVDVSGLLGRVWAESTEEQAEDGYVQQSRIVAAILDRHVNPFTVCTAMEAISAIHDLENGGDLTVMYGVPNTDENRDYWLDYERQNLTFAAMQLWGNR